MIGEKYLFFVGSIPQNECEEFILVASKGLSQQTIKERINTGEIKTGDFDMDEDIMNFDEIEFVESSRWVIVKLLSCG